MDSTVRYHGVEREDVLAIAEAIEIYRREPSSLTAHSGPEPTIMRAAMLQLGFLKTVVQLSGKYCSRSFFNS